MWVCPSCMMENDDNDLNCYMCGEKRPHIAQVRKPKEPKPAPQPPAPSAGPVLPVAEPAAIAVEAPTSAVPLMAANGAPADEPAWDDGASGMQSPAAQQNDAPTPVDDSAKNALLSDFVAAIKPTEPLASPAEPVFSKPEAAAVQKEQEENPFASIFNAAMPSEQSPQQGSQPREKTQKQVTDDFHTVFNDFLNALQQQEAQQAQAARPFAQADGEHTEPGSQTQPSATEETQPEKRRAKKKNEALTIGGGLFSFMRATFVVVIFVWSISFVLFALARFFDGDAAYIAYMAEDLAYFFERGISELNLPDLADYLVSLIGSL